MRLGSPLNILKPIQHHSPFLLRNHHSERAPRQRKRKAHPHEGHPGDWYSKWRATHLPSLLWSNGHIWPALSESMATIWPLCNDDDDDGWWLLGDLGSALPSLAFSFMPGASSQPPHGIATAEDSTSDPQLQHRSTSIQSSCLGARSPWNGALQASVTVCTGSTHGISMSELPTPMRPWADLHPEYLHGAPVDAGRRKLTTSNNSYWVILITPLDSTNHSVDVKFAQKLPPPPVLSASRASKPSLHNARPVAHHRLVVILVSSCF